MTRTIKAVLVDLSGTLHIGNEAILGAIEACRNLQQVSGVDVRFLTNTTKTSSVNLLQQLRNIGFTEAEIPDIVTTAGIVRGILKQYKEMKPLCLLEKDLIQDDLNNEVSHQKAETNYNSVLVGLAPDELCYARLNQAFRVLLNNKDASHPTLIALHKAKYFKDKDSQLSLGPGGFVSCLEEAAGVEAMVIGKPNPAYFHSALGPHVKPEEAIMVGDDVASDCLGARNAGLGTCILVKTGKYRKGDEIQLQDKNESSNDFHVVDSIVEAVDVILTLIGEK